MQRRSAYSPAMIGRPTDQIFAGQNRVGSCCPDAPCPDIGTDKIGELPVGAALHHDDLFATTREHGSECRTGGTGADDDRVYLFKCRHLTSSVPARCGA